MRGHIVSRGKVYFRFHQIKTNLEEKFNKMNTSILSNENKNIYKKLDNNLLNSGQPINCVGENITNIIPYFNLQFFDVF